MIDEGWYAGAGGGGVRRPGVDITRWSDAIALDKVADYARAKGVRLWLWTHWEALERADGGRLRALREARHRRGEDRLHGPRRPVDGSIGTSACWTRRRAIG
ncbi:MAG: hypothetical protein WDN24_02085 [Sphingomonas sp.]